MAMTAQPTSGSSILGANSTAVLSAAQFREIHKNTWLKRLTADGKKITVGPKKSDRSWVVFCVHDDTEAILEGYAEPRQAPSHNPEWFLSMQSTQHISHSLMPNSNEFEFVITLSNEVVRFHAMSWEIMQEWVDTLRSKLREMKILSPRENLYTKLPEARLPLLPTRDPTSPLPAPPPVPAAIVPGVEPVVVPQSMLQAATSSSSESMARNTATTPSHIPAMSNTLTQNLLNMLSDPISAYSEQLHAVESSGTSHNIANRIVNEQLSTSLNDLQLETRSENETEDCLSPLLRPANGNESLLGNNTPALRTKRHSAEKRYRAPPREASVGQIMTTDSSTVQLRNHPNINSITINPAPVTAPSAKNFLSSVGFSSSNKDKRRKVLKSQIGQPTNFVHLSHVGWDANKGFDLTGNENDEHLLQI